MHKVLLNINFWVTLFASSRRPIYLSFLSPAAWNSFHFPGPFFSSVDFPWNLPNWEHLGSDRSLQSAFVCPPSWIAKFTRSPFKPLTVWNFWPWIMCYACRNNGMKNLCSYTVSRSNEHDKYVSIHVFVTSELYSSIWTFYRYWMIKE